MNAIEVRNVSKTFGRTRAVDELNLSVPSGSVYGFIGPNGSGKTTTLRMIMNIIMADHGTIEIFGEKMHGACTDRIGYLPEERGLYREMKVREILRFYGKLKGGRDIDRQIDRWFARLNMQGWDNKKVKDLSKGMSQKVQFLATIVSQPELVILDEPFSGLDPVNQNTMKDAVLDLQQRGSTVIFSTHDMSVAEKMCDFIFMIFKGRKVLDGTLVDIQDEYGNDTIRLRTAGGNGALRNLPGVEKINDFGQVQELRLVEGGDPQQVLRQLMEHTTVHSFDVVKPSLENIFVRIAAPETQQARAGEVHDV